MKKLSKEHYKEMNWQQQLDNMASTLTQISTKATIADHDETVVACLRKAACFIEWSTTTVPPELLSELTALQRELLTWQRIWPVEAARPLLALYAHKQSDHILRIARFYDFDNESPTQNAS